jgi:hypothetical protein
MQDVTIEMYILSSVAFVKEIVEYKRQQSQLEGRMRMLQQRGSNYKITTTNYIYKTSLYTTFRMYSLGPWPLKILMFALLVTREIATYS